MCKERQVQRSSTIVSRSKIDSSGMDKERVPRDALNFLSGRVLKPSDFLFDRIISFGSEKRLLMCEVVSRRTYGTVTL